MKEHMLVHICKGRGNSSVFMKRDVSVKLFIIEKHRNH